MEKSYIVPVLNYHATKADEMSKSTAPYLLHGAESFLRS
jgi:hypothetical protein